MSERTTEDARGVTFFARFESSRFGSTVVQPEHPLLYPAQLKNDRPDLLFVQLESVLARAASVAVARYRDIDFADLRPRLQSF